MGHEDGAGRVDFVVGDPGTQVAAAPPRGPRRRGPLVVLAALALAVGGIVLVQHATSGHHAMQAAPAPTSSSASTPSAAPVAAPTVAAATGPFAFCPRYTACYLTAYVPPALVAAVRASFPTAVVRTARSGLVRRDNARSDALAERTVVVTAGRLQITVTFRDGDPAGGQPAAGRAVTREVDGSGFLTVAVDTDHGAPLPSFQTLQRLAADPRLLTQ